MTKFIYDSESNCFIDSRSNVIIRPSDDLSSKLRLILFKIWVTQLIIGQKLTQLTRTVNISPKAFKLAVSLFSLEKTDDLCLVFAGIHSLIVCF